MAADPNYEGFLKVGNAWATAILVKHLAVLGMVIVGAYMQWVIQPELARLALLAERGRAAPPAAESLRRRESALTWLNLFCALVTLACTAIATAQ
jgi:hypothetical protein